MSNLEALRQGMVGEGPRAGWRETVGARVAEVEPGHAVVELDAHAGHRHEGGVVQGGIVTQIADAAMGLALMTRQPDGMANTTIELKINFLRPFAGVPGKSRWRGADFLGWLVEGRLRAIGRVVEMRRTLLFAEADVVDDQDRLIARASSTCLAMESGPWRRR